MEFNDYTLKLKVLFVTISGSDWSPELNQSLRQSGQRSPIFTTPLPRDRMVRGVIPTPLNAFYAVFKAISEKTSFYTIMSLHHQTLLYKWEKRTFCLFSIKYRNILSKYKFKWKSQIFRLFIFPLSKTKFFNA